MEHKILKTKDRGYTLIELLIVMVVMITMGGIIVGTLVAVLRGSNKNTTIDDIRRTGNSALIQLSRMIEFSQSFVGVGNMVNNSVSYSSNCVLPSPAPTYTYLKLIAFDNAETIFSCSGSPLTVASNGASLVDITKVVVSSCFFTCVQNDFADLPIIGINFKLSQKSSSLFFENIYSIPFQTSVKLRNVR